MGQPNDADIGGPRSLLRVAGLVAVCGAFLAVVYGCDGGGGSTPADATPEPSYRVEDDLNDCFTRPADVEPERVPCEDAVDIAAVEFRRDAIVVEGVAPIVVGDRPLEVTAVIDTGAGRLTVTASSPSDGEWDAECALGQTAEKCAARVDGSELLVDISPFTLEGQVSVTLLDLSYFRTESEGGVGDFLDSTLEFTLE